MFIRFTVRVCLERLLICLCVYFRFVQLSEILSELLSDIMSLAELSERPSYITSYTLNYGIKWLEKIICLRKNLSFYWKNSNLLSHWKFGGAWQTICAMLHQVFNDFIPCTMHLRQWRHRSVTKATTELSNVLLSPLAECRLDDVTLTST